MAYDPVVYSNHNQTRTWTTTGGALGVVGEVDNWTIFRNSNGDITGWGWTPVIAPSLSPSASAVATSTGVNPTETSYSLYGHTVPLSVFGVGRIGGEIISGPWIENGLASFIISFGVPANPSGTRILREIAFDSEVVWTGSLTGAGTPSSSGFSTEPFTVRFYDGTLTQAADALETAHFGADAVAYRPQILLAFENLPLAGTKFGKIPYVAAVIADTHGDDVNLGEAFERLAYSPWVGFTSAQFETIGITDGLVSGGLIIADQTDFLSMIQAFGRFYPKWSILQTDKLRIVDRGSDITPDIILDSTKMTGQVQLMRQEPNSVPSILELSTIDPAADYTIVPSRAQSPRAPVAVTTSITTDAAYLPAIMDSATRIALVTYAKHHEDRARKQIGLTAMIYGLELEPGDLMGVVNLSDDFPGGETFRVLETLHGANYVVEITAESILQCTVTSLTTPPPVIIVVGSAFDPSTLSNATLSNANLTVTRSNVSTGGVQSSAYKSAGKFYFEVTVGASHGSTDFVGVMSSSYGYFFAVNGNTGAGAGVWLGSGNIVISGGPSGSLGGAVSAGSIISVAFDADNDRIWFRVNGGNWNGSGTADPATNTGGAAYPVAAMAPAVAFSPYGSPVAGDNLTANFGATAFTYSVPFGFTPGWPP